MVIDGIDIAQLLQSAMFDYVRRALEALTVGTALAMQASALAVLAEFGCLTQSDPRAATVTSMTPLLSAAQVSSCHGANGGEQIEPRADPKNQCIL